MSFASILSGPTEERSPPKKQSPPPGLASVHSAAPSVNAASLSPPPPISAQPKVRDIEPAPTPSSVRLEKKPSTDKRRRNMEKDQEGAGISANGVDPSKAPRPRKILSEKESEVVNKYMAEIDNAEKSDVEAPGFEKERERYLLKGKKRALDVERAEGLRRKVRFPLTSHPTYLLL